MIWTIFILLLALWIFSVFVAHMGGFIHLILVAAVAVFLFNLVSGRGTRV